MMITNQQTRATNMTLKSRGSRAGQKTKLLDDYGKEKLGQTDLV